MNIDIGLEYLVAAMLLLGGFFALVGRFGLFKLGSFGKRPCFAILCITCFTSGIWNPAASVE